MIFSSHVKRWITGLSALPFLIGWIGWGTASMFALLITIVCIICLWEYFQMFSGGNVNAIYLPPISLGYISGIFILFAAYSQNVTWMIPWIFIADFLLCSLMLLPRFKTDTSIVTTVAMQIQGMIYVPLLISTLVRIRNADNGILWIFFLLAIVFAGDVGAFYAGSHLGRHKLCPAVSPNKTIEGSIGGLCANVFVGSIFKICFLPSLPWPTSLFMFLFVGTAGQIGDLYESALKRSVHVKDSGTLLPGHGGMLDRIDALLFASPLMLLFKEYIL